MTESELHRRLKLALARELVEMGYQSGVEVPTGDGGYIDVQGKRGNEIINIEIWKTHIPNWLVFRFEEAKEIRKRIYEDTINSISLEGHETFYIGTLIDKLVESKYFNKEAARKYVINMIKDGWLEGVPTIVNGQEQKFTILKPGSSDMGIYDLALFLYKFVSLMGLLDAREGEVNRSRLTMILAHDKKCTFEEARTLIRKTMQLGLICESREGFYVIGNINIVCFLICLLIDD